MSNQSENNERELLLRISQGDQVAFNLLVDLYWKKVYSSTLALTKRPETAEELTQDIFIKVWTQRDRLARIENFGVYIYVIGKNEVISALRRKIRESVADFPENIAENILLPDMQLEMKEMHQVVIDAIERLPVVRKKVFQMNRLDGLTYEEIAAQLDISRNTVKDHMVMALNFLRNHMRQWTDKTMIFLFVSLACFLSNNNLHGLY